MRPQPVKCDVVYLVQHRSDISTNVSIESLEWNVGRLARGNFMDNSYSNIGCCTLLHVPYTYFIFANHSTQPGEDITTTNDTLTGK